MFFSPGAVAHDSRVACILNRPHFGCVALLERKRVHHPDSPKLLQQDWGPKRASFDWWVFGDRLCHSSENLRDTNAHPESVGLKEAEIVCRGKQRNVCKVNRGFAMKNLPIVNFMLLENAWNILKLHHADLNFTYGLVNVKWPIIINYYQTFMIYGRLWHSNAFDRTPAEALQEIIVVDDGSWPPLSIEPLGISWPGEVHVMTTNDN